MTMFTDDVAPSPDYCPICGNLDFYAARNTWVCHWCKPLPRRDVQFPRDRGKAPIPIGPLKTQEPRTGFFSAAATLAAWPACFTPSAPKGPAVGAIHLRKLAAQKAMRAMEATDESDAGESEED